MTSIRSSFIKLAAMCALGFPATACIAAAAPGVEYRGAEAVLKQAREGSARTKPEITTNQPNEALRADLKAFQQKSAALPPADAAKQWLALVDRYLQLELPALPFSRGRSSPTRPVQAAELVEALPGPEAWPDLAKAVEGRPPVEGLAQLHELGLRILAHTLTRDTARRREDVAALEKIAGNARTSQAYFFNSLLELVWKANLETMEDPDAILKSVERRLNTQNPENRYSGLRVPNLVDLVGAEKSEALLRRALVESEVPLEIEEGTTTERLAAKLALDLVNNLKTPQWSLANSLDAGPLFEAMDKRFGKKPDAGADESNGVLVPDLRREDSSRSTAQIYYLLGLIAHGRTQDAVKVAEQFRRDDSVYVPETAIRDMERAGFAPQMNDFFAALLKQNPELPFWRQYVELAAHAGKTSEMVALVQTNLARTTLSKNQRLELEQLLHTALLADDQIDAGVAELRQLMQASTKAGSRRSWSQPQPEALALELAQIGRLLERTNWFEEGIAAAQRTAEDAQQPESWGGGEIAVANLLVKMNRGQEAEAVLAKALAKSSPAEEGMGSSSARILIGLVRLYHQAGRYSDVLYLFDNAPQWGAKDLKDVNGYSMDWDELRSRVSHATVETPVGFYAASAVAKTGRTNEARKLLDASLDEAPGCDRLYELLLSVEGDQAPARLDTLFARDPFEERPLIWKAHWLRTRGRLEEAEQTARKAISIDPSDGEEGPGDRLRAYAELAEIRAARGDQKESDVLRGAVEAIRESERADEVLGAGLLSRAIRMYEAALLHFADAYCVHARLAVQLSELGRHDEAAEHYRRAYELMPESFGRVESHCFGCERAFDGERAQSLAEKVFTQLAAKTPNKPQVHYLFGYLREEQSRYTEAADQYRIAVRLDPDYLNAWVKLQGTTSHVRISAADRDAIAFNILKLDPLSRHSSARLDDVSDLSQLWRIVAAASAKQPVARESLYPLRASKAEIEKRAAAHEGSEDSFGRNEWDYEGNRMEGNTATPAAAVASNAYAQVGQRLLDRNMNPAGDE